MKYIAHRDEGREQSILDHLQGTAEKARDFAEVFGKGDWGYCCGMLHDIGKYSGKFQRRIQGEEIKVDHATAGARVCLELGGMYPFLEMCIAGHHAGLADYGTSMDAGNSPTTLGRRKKKIEDFLALLNPVKDNQNEVHAFFEKLRKDEQIMINDMELNPSQKFYILCLAPNAARLSVRFFYQSSFGNITKNLACHYERMQMIKPKWEEREYLGIEDMLKETVNMNSRDKKPISNMAAMVFSAILQNSRYPASLYTDALIRIRAEQGCVTWGRASIVKAFLMKNHKNTEGEICMGLNEESNDVAYVLGRLFSVLESIQTDANPGIKSTIRDRYFNSACATPASVFPVLFKLKNSHIKKLEREKESAKVYYEKLLTQIVGKLEMYPKRLSLEEQGRFILGYYHQMQKKYEKREEK